MVASATSPSATFIAEDPEALATLYAEWLSTRLALHDGRFRIALSGGTTPQPLYRLLGSSRWRPRLDWSRFEVFWGDERLVPPTAADSNYGEAHRLWLSQVPIPPEQIHAMPTQGTPEACAQAYEALLQQHYGSGRLTPHTPLFDVVLLGVGDNGHTASLMPGSAVLDERARWVAAVRPGLPQLRLTLTFPVLASARAVSLVATGAGKQRIVEKVRGGDPGLPAAQVQSEGELFWFLDRPCAGNALPTRNDGGKN
jgi:6-phosphogluconolactonase